ncbi:MAG: adenine deaminase [Elusimicrobiota bacterium]|nr:adenine deaminase [Elusimicrobiota bacterium]
MNFISKYELVKAARGKIPVDTLFKNARLVNVFSGNIEKTGIAVHKGVVVGFGNYKAKRTVDIKNNFIIPGLVEGHIHTESSMLEMGEFVKAVLPYGTTTVICDPHEIANVLGLEGITYMLQSAKYQPMDIYFTLPSTVPATDMETSGARLSAVDLMPYFSQKWVVGLGEVMNVPGVLENDREVFDKLKIAAGKAIEGHAPGLRGKDLYAYITSGVHSDHESFGKEEALEKLSAGMTVMIREGSVAKNLKTLAGLVNDKNQSRFCLVSDDRNPIDLVEKGHLDYTIRKAISLGIDPVSAIRMATINPARHFGLRNAGAIAPGFFADFITVGNLSTFKVGSVYKRGEEVAKNGKILKIRKLKTVPLRSSINVKWIMPAHFKLPAKTKKANVIELIPDELITKKRVMSVKTEDGFAISDTKNDILKIVVVERHKTTGNISQGFVKGFGIKKGALASSVGHDSHNIICVGCDDESIYHAVLAIIKAGGGLGCFLPDRQEILQLPVAGLMSDRDLPFVYKKLKQLHKATAAMGCKIDEPFMTLSFLALPVIPDLKITDKGLVDVTKNKFTKLFV